MPVESTTPSMTPPEIAKARKISVRKVLYWIESGELEAINHATRRSNRPLWKISPDALSRFDRSRSSRPSTPVSLPPRRTPKKSPDFIEYV